MQSILGALSSALHTFADVPLAYRSEEDQRSTVQTLTNALAQVTKQLETQNLSTTRVGQSVVRAQTTLTQQPLNEHELATSLNEFVGSLSHTQKTQRYEALQKTIDRIVARTEPLDQSEQAAAAARDRLTADEVELHDRELLEKQMQLYGLDYFLMMHKQIKDSPIDRQSALISKGDTKLDLPALKDDALQDDMLKKIVYELYDRDLRQRMIRDYYRYKLSFLTLGSAQPPSAEPLTTIAEALRAYCIALIDTSLEQGVTMLSVSLFKPYGVNVTLESVKSAL